MQRTGAAMNPNMAEGCRIEKPTAHPYSKSEKETIVLHIHLKFTSNIILSLVLIMGLFCTPGFAGGDYPESVKNMPPIVVVKEGRERIIRLTDVYDFHGNACPGATMVFQAVRYGLELLYGAQTPDLDDLVILSRAPGGPMDMFDFLMKGPDKSNRTWPPAGVVMAAENFNFQFLRKSTMQAVTVRLKDGLWPRDWFELRDKHRAGTITDAEKEKRKKDRGYVLSQFPGKSFEELFGEPEVYTFIAWGHMEKGEMDRLIREQRRQARERR
jgi:hypothetical protein